jgi:hypothetical protein
VFLELSPNRISSRNQFASPWTLDSLSLILMGRESWAIEKGKEVDGCGNGSCFYAWPFLLQLLLLFQSYFLFYFFRVMLHARC